MASVNWLKCKNGGGDVVAYARHNFRKNENYSNPDLDLSLSEENYFLGCENYEDAMQKYKERLHDVEANMTRLRSDRVNGIMLEYICPDFIQRSQRKFFSDTYKEIEDFFGKDNVIYGAVHCDEIHQYRDNETGERKFSRPHIHILVVPEKEGRLCAKEVMARSEFNKVNNLINDYCLERYGKTFLTGEQKRGLSVEKLKTEGLRTEDLLLSASVSNLGKKQSELSGEIESKTKELDYYKQSVEQLKKKIEDFSNSELDFSPLKERKDSVILSKNDYNSLKESAKNGIDCTKTLQTYLDYSKVENFSSYVVLELLTEELRKKLAEAEGREAAGKAEIKQIEAEKKALERNKRETVQKQLEFEDKIAMRICDLTFEEHEKNGETFTVKEAMQECQKKCFEWGFDRMDLRITNGILSRCEKYLGGRYKDLKTPEKDRDYCDYDYDR